MKKAFPPSRPRAVYEQGGKYRQLLINAPSVRNTRNFSMGTQTPPIPLNMEIGMNAVPLIETVKTYFDNFAKPKVDVENANNTTTCDSTTRLENNSTPNSCVDKMSDPKCEVSDENPFVDIPDDEMLTKFFVNMDLPVAASKAIFMPKTREIEREMEFNCKIEPTTMPAKEHEQSSPASPPASVTSDFTRFHPSLILPEQKSKKYRKRGKKSNTRSLRERTATGVNATKKANAENREEKQKHELEQTIEEDIETESETMSTDESDESLVIVTAPKQTSQVGKPKLPRLSTEDVPVVPTTLNDAMIEKPLETPDLPTSPRRERQTSESNDDSFIVFEYDDCQRRLSESSDDFIIFDSDADVDSDTEEDDSTSFEENSSSESEFNDKKKVRFKPIPKIRYMRTWAYAHHQARIGEWYLLALRRLHFFFKIEFQIKPFINPILDSAHRQKIYNERFDMNTVQ